MSEGYPPFSGDDSICVKCGNTRPSTAYRASTCIQAGSRHIETIGPPDEHFCRTCWYCGYPWDEAIPA